MSIPVADTLRILQWGTKNPHSKLIAADFTVDTLDPQQNTQLFVSFFTFA